MSDKYIIMTENKFRQAIDSSFVNGLDYGRSHEQHSLVEMLIQNQKYVYDVQNIDKDGKEMEVRFVGNCK